MTRRLEDRADLVAALTSIPGVTERDAQRVLRMASAADARHRDGSPAARFGFAVAAATDRRGDALAAECHRFGLPTTFAADLRQAGYDASRASRLLAEAAGPAGRVTGSTLTALTINVAAARRWSTA